MWLQVLWYQRGNTLRMVRSIMIRGSNLCLLVQAPLPWPMYYLTYKHQQPQPHVQGKTFLNLIHSPSQPPLSGRKQQLCLPQRLQTVGIMA
jgi:hypothetical protein